MLVRIGNRRTFLNLLEVPPSLSGRDRVGLGIILSGPVIFDSILADNPESQGQNVRIRVDRLLFGVLSEGNK